MATDKRLGGSQYNVGDTVYYRGGDPASTWNISNVGNRFLTIENTNPQYGGDKQKIVQPHEVYQATSELSQYNQYGGNEYEPSFAPPPYYDGGQAANYMQPMMMGGGGMPPAITIAPVFKMVGGSDFSTGGQDNPNEQNVLNSGARMQESGEPIIMKSGLQEPSIPKASEVTGGGNGEIDFKRLLIKKV